MLELMVNVFISGHVIMYPSMMAKNMTIFLYLNIDFIKIVSKEKNCVEMLEGVFYFYMYVCENGSFQDQTEYATSHCSSPQCDERSYGYSNRRGIPGHCIHFVGLQ